MARNLIVTGTVPPPPMTPSVYRQPRVPVKRGKLPPFKKLGRGRSAAIVKRMST